MTQGREQPSATSKEPLPERIRIYLDDERQTPEGFIRCNWPEEVTALLERAAAEGVVVEELSLDHDLGEYENSHVNPRTGYDVLLWLEKKVFTENFVPPIAIRLHTANTSARDKMMRARAAIYRKATDLGIEYRRQLSKSQRESVERGLQQAKAGEFVKGPL